MFHRYLFAIGLGAGVDDSLQGADTSESTPDEADNNWQTLDASARQQLTGPLP